MFIGTQELFSIICVVSDLVNLCVKTSVDDATKVAVALSVHESI